MVFVCATAPNTTIGFVTWPPFYTIIIYKDSPVTKPIIVVKMLCKLLYIIQVKGFLTNNCNFLAFKVFGRLYHAACTF